MICPLCMESIDDGYDYGYMKLDGVTECCHQQDCIDNAHMEALKEYFHEKELR